MHEFVSEMHELVEEMHELVEEMVKNLCGNSIKLPKNLRILNFYRDSQFTKSCTELDN